MELEHKLVDDRDAARAEAQQREELEQRGDDLLPEPVIAAIEHAAPERRAHLLGAVRMILDRDPVEITSLGFPTRETRALSALEIAVRGRDELGRFVYAEDRRDLLERSLAALQPDIMHVAATTALELHTQLTEVSDRVAELRHTLGNLEDAQDELVESEHKTALDAAATPKPPPVSEDAAATADLAPSPSTLSGPDLPDPTPTPSTLSGPDLPDPTPAPSTLSGPDLLTGPGLPGPTPAPSTLSGPDLPDPTPTPSTLSGPDLPDPTPTPSTLSGPDLPDPTPAPSTLSGPDLPDPTPAPTALTGPDLPEPAPVPSSLGEPADVARAQAGKPWWRRPFG